MCVSVRHHDADLEVGQSGPPADPKLPEVLDPPDQPHLPPSWQSEAKIDAAADWRAGVEVRRCGHAAHGIIGLNRAERTARAWRAGPHPVPAEVLHVLLGALAPSHHDLVLLSRRRLHPVVARLERCVAPRLLRVLEQDPLRKLEVGSSCPRAGVHRRTSAL